MESFDKLSRSLIEKDKNGKIDSFVKSSEGQRLGKMIDGKALKKAAMQGDQETLTKILAQVMSTQDGKALVKKISESFGK